MNQFVIVRRILLGCVLCLFAAPTVWGVRQTGLTLSTPEQFKDEFQTVPCKDKDRQDAVKALYEKMGAAPSNIAVEKKGGVENVVIRKPGTADGIIVIGAHYDKVTEGCGALDNWSGTVAVAHLYRTLKNVSLKKTILFVAFGKEERGLIGSRAMVDAIKKDELAQYCAMVNLDTFGLAAPQVMDNTSSEKLEAVTEEIAKEMKMPFSHARIDGGDADSSSFLAKKIPAITLHGMTNAWPKILHSNNDQAAKVNPESVYLGYRLALALVIRLDAAACDAYRR